MKNRVVAKIGVLLHYKINHKIDQNMVYKICISLSISTYLSKVISRLSFSKA